MTFLLELALALAAIAAGSALAFVALAALYNRRRNNESGLGSDEEWVRELLGYQGPHWPPSNGHASSAHEDVA